MTTSKKRQEIAKVEFRDYTPGDERSIVKILAASHPQGWQNEDYWRWKHLHRPGFIHRDVVTAHVDGKMVGCFHGAILPLRLEPGLEVPMSFDGDFAVLLEHRGTGIPIQAYDLTDRRMLEDGVVLRGGFTSQELNKRFYHKRFGYVFIPSVTTQFRKIISLRLFKTKVEVFGEKLLARSWLGRILKRHPLVVDVRVDNFPPCYLELTERAFQLRDGIVQHPHLRVQMPYSLLVALVESPGRLLKSTVFNILKGRLRIHGIIRNGPGLLVSLLYNTVKR